MLNRPTGHAILSIQRSPQDTSWFLGLFGLPQDPALLPGFLSTEKADVTYSFQRDSRHLTSHSCTQH